MAKFLVRVSYKNYLDELDAKIERSVGKVAKSAGFDSLAKTREVTFDFFSESAAKLVKDRLSYLPEDCKLKVEVVPLKKNKK